MSASSVGMTCSPRWSSATAMPSSRRFSAISRPMKPPPTTVALRAAPSVTASRMRKVSSTLRSA